MKLPLHVRFEIWQQGRGYLSGVVSIAHDYPTKSFDDFLTLCATYNYTGGWGKEALRNAWNRGRAGLGV